MIQIKNIVKKYLSGENEVTALKDISINFRNSEFVSILGPSGCGKTTMLNIIGGLDKYTSGDIVINGVSTKQYKDKDWDAYRNHYIGFVFQSYNLISHLNILENVELALSIAGLNPKEKKKKAMKALKEVGLSDQMKKRPNQLSGGQMQRVAIARAIVNEPKIILADEPTGALDSETSVQVMDILKKISDKYLIVMVTHNEELAKKYSTRIISVLDGKLIGDTNPYNPTEEEVTADRIAYEKSDTKDKEHKKKKKIKSAMSYGTSFNLSLKNLWHKKGKTIIESLAGSIGIIGIALVLAVSSGFTNYINNLQTTTLGSYPLTLPMIALDYDKIMNGGLQGGANRGKGDDESVSVYDLTGSASKLTNLNFFREDFVNYIDDFSKDEKNTDKIKAVQYDYGINMPVLTKQKDGTNNVTVVQSEIVSSTMSGSTSASVYEIVNNKDWVLENYELVGSWPDSPDEMMFVIGGENRIDKSVADKYGFQLKLKQDTSNSSVEYENIKYSDIIENSEYVVIFNNSLFTRQENTFTKISFPEKSNETNSTITDIYNSAKNLSEFSKLDDGALKVKISGILKLKENVDVDILSTGLVYTSQLREFYRDNSKNSEIVKYAESLIEANRLKNESVETATEDDNYKIDLPWTFTIAISELSLLDMPPVITYDKTYTKSDEPMKLGIKDSAKNLMNKEITYKEAYEISLLSVGASSMPYAIYFYPTSFDAKQDIIDYISAWNETESGKTNRMVYSDATAILTNTMGQMVDIISYVLIAFAGISLVVSSIMIGIITYSSVIERTKEIGVLRSIGARKKDISRIFNSETILIGLFAGLLGVFISWILTFPISAIIINVAGGAITTSMAILEPLDALWLVIVSTLLTFIAGTIPARIASKKDPVKCLRSND